MIALLRDGTRVEALEAGEAGEVILDRTRSMPNPAGRSATAANCSRRAGTVFEVEDTQKRGGAHSHLGRVARRQARSGRR